MTQTIAKTNLVTTLSTRYVASRGKDKQALFFLRKIAIDTIKRGEESFYLGVKDSLLNDGNIEAHSLITDVFNKFSTSMILSQPGQSQSSPIATITAIPLVITGKLPPKQLSARTVDNLINILEPRGQFIASNALRLYPLLLKPESIPGQLSKRFELLESMVNNGRLKHINTNARTPSLPQHLDSTQCHYVRYLLGVKRGTANNQGSRSLDSNQIHIGNKPEWLKQAKALLSSQLKNNSIAALGFPEALPSAINSGFEMLVREYCELRLIDFTRRLTENRKIKLVLSIDSRASCPLLKIDYLDYNNKIIESDFIPIDASINPDFALTIATKVLAANNNVREISPAVAA